MVDASKRGIRHRCLFNYYNSEKIWMKVYYTICWWNHYCNERLTGRDMLCHYYAKPDLVRIDSNQHTVASRKTPYFNPIMYIHIYNGELED